MKRGEEEGGRRVTLCLYHVRCTLYQHPVQTLKVYSCTVSLYLRILYCVAYCRSEAVQGRSEERTVRKQREKLERRLKSSAEARNKPA